MYDRTIQKYFKEQANCGSQCYQCLSRETCQIKEQVSMQEVKAHSCSLLVVATSCKGFKIDGRTQPKLPEGFVEKISSGVCGVAYGYGLGYGSAMNEMLKSAADEEEVNNLTRAIIENSKL